MRILKSIVLLLAVMIAVSGVSYAGANKGVNKGANKGTSVSQQTIPQITLDNKVFTLKYSTNKTQSGEYLNEYYKSDETGYNWTELITVCEFPNYPNSPSNYAESILSRDNAPDNYDRPMSTNSRSGKVTCVFLLAGKMDETKYIEFNVMQVLPYKNSKGIKTLLYAKKYNYKTREELADVFNKMEADKQKYFNLVKELEMPAVLHENIE